ncbi:MAG: SPOR domain-containing protein [candidate division Zixibacteria bacterium]|nr:SPOR domain-containing protein [candidate division Zixibacteria bacterium]
MFLLQGDIQKADEELARLPQGALPDGDRLFLQGLLEKRGIKARQLLDSAITAGLDERYRPEATLRLLQMAEAFDDSGAVVTLSDQFVRRWPDDSMAPQVLASVAGVLPDGGKRQKQFLDRLIADHGDTYFAGCARLAEADLAFRAGQFRDAATLCRKVNDSDDDNLAPAALILLARIALRDNEAEQALLNYNILREGFEHAIGQAELTEALRQISDRKSTVEADEKLSGITYAVQVGVFSVKENAERMAGRVKTYGYPVTVSKLIISGKPYHVVRAGRFATEQAANVAKGKLERSENELFKVVVNNDK